MIDSNVDKTTLLNHDHNEWIKELSKPKQNSLSICYC